MSGEKFNWKGLFLNEEGGSNSSESNSTSTKQEKSNESTSKFPESTTARVSNVNEDTLKVIVEMYESGFESLNQPGYDFYEFFKAIKAVGSHESSVYKMALSMAQSVDGSVSKSSLLTQADFYINEINKVHKQYESQGNTKKSDFKLALKTKKESLSLEVSSLERKLMEIQNQISLKKNELQSLDDSQVSELAEIDQKIVANDQAKSKILETIMTVVNGIKSNI